MPKPEGYVEVKDRIIAFKERHPEGVLQAEIVELTGDRVTVKAYAYREPGDPRPGIGHSFMAIPGATSFTRGSELENAETSAWGRAIAALGFEVKESIASAEEVANKAGGEDEQTKPARRSSSGGLTDKQRGLLLARFREAGLEGQQRVAVMLEVLGKGSTKQMTSPDLDKVLEALKNPELVQRAKNDVKPETPE